MTFSPMSEVIDYVLARVRGALNRVWRASTASTVRLGKNFIKQTL
jgi:hypothetical protein